MATEEEFMCKKGESFIVGIKKKKKTGSTFSSLNLNFSCFLSCSAQKGLTQSGDTNA